MSMHGRSIRNSRARNLDHRAARCRDSLACTVKTRRGRRRHDRSLAGADQGRAAPLADRAGAFRDGAGCSWPTRPPGPCRWSIPRTGECSMKWPRATVPPAWPSRPTASGASSRTGMVTTSPCSRFETIAWKWPAGSRSGPSREAWCFRRDGKTAYVAVGVANEVAKVDLDSREVTARVSVGREPRGIAISPDGSLLLVGNARSQNVSVVSTRSMGVLRTIPIEGDNLRQVAISADGKHGYIANMKNRGFATTANNIDLGWVLGQRLTRVDLDDAGIRSPPSPSTLGARPRPTPTAWPSARMAGSWPSAWGELMK